MYTTQTPFYIAPVYSVYLYAKRINEEIQRLSPVLKDYRSIGVEFVKSKKNNPHFVFGRIKQKKNNRIDGFSGVPKVKKYIAKAQRLQDTLKTKTVKTR